MTFAIGFKIAVIIVILLNALIAVASFKQKDKKGKYLAITSIFGILTGIFYTISATSRNYRVVAIFSSLYFISIDGLLLCFLAFIVYWDKPRTKRIFKIATYITKTYLLFEVIIFVINMFNPIAIDYIYGYEGFMHYAYEMKPLYICHLVYCYINVASILSILIFKLLKVPKEYRAPYFYIIYTFVFVIIINAIFLFIPKNYEWQSADYSVLFYFLGTLICYWASYIFPKRGLLYHFKSYIFENIDQGIILYDYNDQMLVFNNKAIRFLASTGVTKETPLNEFLKKCNLSIRMNEDAYSLQCYINEYGKQKPLRCDYRKLINEYNDIIGRLFVFADAQLDTDLLTGFHNWESFRKFAVDNGKNYPDPTTICVCDINRLAMFNTMYGRNKGDNLLKELSEHMRKIFPEDTYYVRGQEAYLIAICYNKNEKDVMKCLTELSEGFEGKLQFAVDSVQENDENLLTTLLRVFQGLKAKKLLDNDSTRSTLLSTIFKAIRESDPDTEKHVERTQKLGAVLGQKMGLSDIEQSRLSLLCLLHDIGKIGIPLSVINKPSKLNDDEWALIRSHTTKGEAICDSTPELKCIAKEVRYPHERWDGKGYPDGLSRESIPLLSRIVGVVDAFDAMISYRPYRQTKTVNEAKEELVKNAGTQFDPRIVEEFISVLEDGYNVEANLNPDTSSHKEFVEVKEEKQLSENIHPIVYTRYVLNTEMRIVDVDNEFTNLTGYSIDDILRNKLHQYDLLPKEDRTYYLLEVERQLRENSIAYIEHRLICKNGSIKRVYCVGRKYFDSVEREEKSEIIVVNATTTYAAKLLAKSIEQKSEIQLKQWEDTYRRDSLTGLLTHMAFVNDIEQKRFECPELKSMLIMMDLDDFKKFNDTYGHHAGDEFLIQIGQVLKSVTHNHDLACRMGGDEFMLAIFIRPEDNYREIAKEIFDKISMRLSVIEKSTTFSVGVALNDGSFKSFDQQYEAVDKVLYHSKNNGKNRLCFYEDFKKEEHE